VRYNGIFWSEVEPQAGQRDWSKLASVEAELRAINAQGAAPIVIVRSTPPWAQQRSGSACGPIREATLDEFADFMAELVRRYSQPPFNVRYWELGNEPDVDAALVGGNSPFGCWGDANDEFYGGGYYAEMLKAVYPAIKAANPEAQVVFGGLLLDCEPGVPLPDGQPCVAGKFFEGVLRNGGGAAFDVANYHAYVYWADGSFDWDRGLPKWQHRDNAPLGKLAYLRETMARYGVEKPVLLSEAGLLCFRSDPSCEPNGFRDAQANYAVRLYTRSAANGVFGTLWYTLNGPGFQESGLLDRQQQPRPAYTTIAFLSKLIGGAQYSGDLSQGEVEGYAFIEGTTTYHIYWTNSAATVELPLPEGANMIYTYRGEQQSADAETLTVSFAPQIVVIEP
jgi:hypothetical protein